MELRADYLLDLTSEGLTINGLPCGVTPTPKQLESALGQPARVLNVEPEVAGGRHVWLYDELGVRALVDVNATVLMDVCVYFELGFARSPSMLPSLPKRPFSGTIRIGRYRLRQGVSFIAALEVAKVHYNGFRVAVSEHEDRVATCDIAVPLLS